MFSSQSGYRVQRPMDDHAKETGKAESQGPNTMTIRSFHFGGEEYP